MSANPYAVRSAVYACLSAGTALAAEVDARIYHHLAPGTAAYPFVTFDEQGDAADMLALGGAEGYVVHPYIVKAVAPARRDAEDAYHAAHQAMRDEAELAATGVRVIGAPRIRIVTYPETVPSDGTVLHHVGGIYHVHAQEG